MFCWFTHNSGSTEGLYFVSFWSTDTSIGPDAEALHESQLHWAELGSYTGWITFSIKIDRAEHPENN